MIERIRVTGSTNADLVARVARGEGVAEGHWLVADRQDAGRGRLGRAWFDGAGNFMGSTVVRIVPGDPAPTTLALVAGLAACEALGPYLPPPYRVMLKWPNDLLIDGAKLGGILLERAGDAIVIGIGINLAAAPDLPDRASIALSRFGPSPDRDLFADGLAAAFALELGRWRTFGLEPMIRRWHDVAHPIGTPLTVSESGITGTFAGLAGDGALQLRLPDGTTQTIHAGEINLAAS